MKQYVDIEKWNRKEHFEFFSQFDDPFFGLTVEVDFTTIYHKAKVGKSSFFIHSLHAIMETIQALPCFRYRIEGDKIACYDVIHPTCTIAREDGTFGFSFIEYSTDIQTFVDRLTVEMERVKAGTGLMVSDNTMREDVIHFSSVPWVAFSDLKHASTFSFKSSTPKISTGKCYEKNNRFVMPISVTVHHGLMDGLHVAQFFERLAEITASK